jgi:hypothetical protein
MTIMNNTREQARPTIIPFGKFQGCKITNLSMEELVVTRSEFRYVSGPVQGAIMAELSRREKVRRDRKLARKLRKLPGKR